MGSKTTEPVPCFGTRRGKDCGAPTFACGHCKSEGVETLGCTQDGCTERKFGWIDKCANCGRSYEKIPQMRLAATPPRENGAGSGVAGRPFAMPQVELLFGGVLAFIILAAAIAGVSGIFAGPRTIVLADAGAAPPTIGAFPAAATSVAYADVCQCYRQGMSLAGTGVSVLSSQYRTGFVQCRAAFGPEGGDAWTSGWKARTDHQIIGAGCRSWRKGYGG